MKQAEIRIGEWLISPAVNQISRPGRLINLEPRLIDLLVCFARNPDVVLSRDELIEQVWTRNYVTPHVVTQSVSELRKSLKDNQPDSPEYIVTIPKRGYKLVATVRGYLPSSSESLPNPSPAAPPEAISCGNSPPMAETRPGSGAFPTGAIRSRGTLVCFIVAVILSVTMIGLALHSNRPVPSPENQLPGLINPRNIDIRLVPGNSCNQWGDQYAYVSGLSDVISRLFNTYTSWSVSDKTSENYMLRGYPGKTLYIGFVNQRHYRAQQCFMSVRLEDHASQTILLDQRYFITRDNGLIIQNDLINNLSQALKQSWPVPLVTLLRQYSPGSSSVLQQFYQARQLMVKGDIDSLTKARTLLNSITEQQPDFTAAESDKVLADTLHNSEQPFEGKQLQVFFRELADFQHIDGIRSDPVYYQIMTIKALGEGNANLAEKLNQQAMEKEYSWMNVILQGKIHEMKGETPQAVDSYITSFSLRPGKETLYWIENGFFQTRINKVVPYLNLFMTRDG